jgi:diketogulonate reductase-like aldo/keto reductase
MIAVFPVSCCTTLLDEIDMLMEMKTVAFPNGTKAPALGLGTWNIGDRADKREQEIAAIRRALDLGMTVIDTAEMYGEGASEELVGEAIAGRRPEVFLVSKVYPHHATRKGATAACERSLQRLRTDYLDLYLLHWRGSVPLAETLGAFAALQQAGKIRAFGVSNFDTADLQEAWALPEGNRITCNQILYNLTRRSVEHDLLPFCRDHRIPVMAYSPVEQGRLLNNKALLGIAHERNKTPSQIALAWLLAQPEVMAIPKSGNPKHVEENRAAADLLLSTEELAALENAFPRPKQRKPLEML